MDALPVTRRMVDPVIVLREAATSDAYGNTEGAAAELMRLRGSLEEFTGSERLAAGALEAERTASLLIYANDDTRGIRASDTVEARGARWNVRSVGQSPRSPRLLELVLATGVAT